MKKNFLKLSLNQKRNYSGYLWISPFIIGFIFFFFGPMLQAFRFSFNELQFGREGFELNYIGLENFIHALTVDTSFNQYFTETILAVLTNIPAVIIFSFFVANLLNQKFRGRLLVRIIFFLPVILTAGVLYELEEGDLMHQAMQYGETAEEGGLLTAGIVRGFLADIRLPQEFIDYVIIAAGNIPEIIEFSAIPILIFLAGLQSIPSALYEFAKTEGASGWESFWKVTFPLISPLFLTNIIFIIVYSFTAPGNELVDYIRRVAWGRGLYGVSVAMSLMYFLAISIILIIVGWILEKNVVYME